MPLGQRRRSRIIRYVLLAIVLVPLIDYFWKQQSSYPPLHVTSTAQELQRIKSVYVASSLWNAGSLLQDHWIPSLLQLAGDLNAANITVFISIYENGSWDSTKTMLQQLKQTLTNKGIGHEIVMDETSHEQIIGGNASSAGWLTTAHGREMRRLPYLASVRNEALKPLTALAASGVTFDKLIFINDVIFQANDIVTLLQTRGGKYAAACALDFLNPPWNRVDAKTRGLHPPGMYDDFATRDSDGNAIGSHLYPYFVSQTSRRAMLAGEDVPVQSCWNGIVAFDAAPFQNADNPLKFRGIADSLAQYHVEASECCTVHYDNPLTKSHGVWINPAVRVGYSAAAYSAVSATNIGDSKATWPTKAELRWGHWSSKWTWWLRDPGARLSVWKTRYRIRRWQHSHPDESEPALACGSDLAMVLTSIGWAMRGARFE